MGDSGRDGESGIGMRGWGIAGVRISVAAEWCDAKYHPTGRAIAWLARSECNSRVQPQAAQRIPLCAGNTYIPM